MLDWKVVLAPVGKASYALDEGDTNFAAGQLQLQRQSRLINDVTVLGLVEPQTYVKDYFLGDGLSLRFDLSQTPFWQFSRTLVDEEYGGGGLLRTRWAVSDPANAIGVAGGKLEVNGGTGVDGQTRVQFAEKVELGGALVLQHGDVSFSAASDGILGGLYAGDIILANCFAGFRLSKAGNQSSLQAVINGAATGPAIATVAGHHYVLTARLYASEIYRMQQVFHSATHPPGQPLGGETLQANVRVVMEVHDIDPVNPGTIAAESTVIYDNVIASAPQYCSYALVNASDLHCSIAFTRFIQPTDAEVRTALPGQSYRTRLAGALTEGAECRISQGALGFFTQHVPASGERIVVSYRAGGRSVARMTDPASIANTQKEADDGVRGAVCHVGAPAPRTSADCERAAIALLDEQTQPAWAGEYQVWSDFLPGTADDIFPGDMLAVDVPSRQAQFNAIVREVEITVPDPAYDRGHYTLRFANEASSTLGFLLERGQISPTLQLPPVAKSAPATYLAELTSAEVSEISSTALTIDACESAPPGGGFEVRRSDYGWGMENDRNLAGRFATRVFTLPRLSRIQDYYVRPYDASSPPNYSRHSVLLHVDWPL